MTVRQYRQAPTYTVPFEVNGNMHRSWYRWFQDVDNGLPAAQESSVPLTGSPMFYTAPQAGRLIINGGTVSLVSYSRSGTLFGTGQTQGMFTMSQGDQLRIAYTGTPTLTWVPA